MNCSEEDIKKLAQIAYQAREVARRKEFVAFDIMYGIGDILGNYCYSAKVQLQKSARQLKQDFLKTRKDSIYEDLIFELETCAGLTFKEMVAYLRRRAGME